MLNEVIESQLKTIQFLENTKECLLVRLSLIDSESSKKNEYELNEIQLLKIKSEYEIFKLNKTLSKNLELFQYLFEQYLDELKHN